VVQCGAVCYCYGWRWSVCFFCMGATAIAPLPPMGHGGSWRKLSSAAVSFGGEAVQEPSDSSSHRTQLL
jgi:hypothetical protein